MQNLEEEILAAWRRIQPTLDDHALAARLARRRRPTLMRPPRAWCIAIRASDHRIPTHCVDPEEHTVTLSRDQLIQLTEPIRFDPGGESLTSAAAKLGTSTYGLINFRLKKTLRADFLPPTGGRGKPQPILYADRALDPNARGLSVADPAWLWTSGFLATHLAQDFQQTLTRTPMFLPHVSRHRYDEFRHPELDDAPCKRSARSVAPTPEQVDAACWYKWSRSGHYLGTDPTNWRKSFKDLGERPRKDRPKHNYSRPPRPSTSKGSLHFNGFTWQCPHCGKTARTLYLPVRPTHLLQRMQPRLAQCIDIPRKLEGFACGHCHRVKFLSRLQPEAWNDVIAYLTAGLLYGREVPRPDWFTKDRKRPYKPLINARPALQRERVLERLLEGHPRAKIAADLRMTYGAVSQQMWKIFKQEKVRTHRALLRKHNRPFPPHLQLSADRVLAHIQARLSQDDIARKMGITKQAVQSYTSQLYKSGQHFRRLRKRDAVARLVAEGRTNKEIAQALGMSMQNVYDHRSELRVAKRRVVLNPTR